MTFIIRYLYSLVEFVIFDYGLQLRLGHVWHSLHAPSCFKYSE